MECCKSRRDAIKSNHLNCLKKHLVGKKKYLDVLVDPHLVDYAAQYGSVSCLRYLIDKKYPFNEFTMETAAEYGQLASMKYLLGIGCPWDRFTPSIALRRRHWDCLWYAFEKGCDCDPQVRNCRQIVEKEREIAAKIIGRWWLKLYYDPSSRICRKRLRNEYDNLVVEMG